MQKVGGILTESYRRCRFQVWARLSRQPHMTTEPGCRRLAVGTKNLSERYVLSVRLQLPPSTPPHNPASLLFFFFLSSLKVIDKFRSLMMEQPNSLLRKLRALARLQKLQEKLVPTNVKSSV